MGTNVSLQSSDDFLAIANSISVLKPSYSKIDGTKKTTSRYPFQLPGDRSESIIPEWFRGMPVLRLDKE
jgi:hypothetical protein